MNLPNKLTVLRIVLVLAMLVIAYVPIPGEFLHIATTMWILNIIFIAASITDKLDGSLARKNNQITDFGKFLDPIADKMLVLTAMLILVEKGLLPAWIPVVTLLREFMVSGYRMLSAGKAGKVIAANYWGKLKTVTQMTAIILAFINIDNTNAYGAFLVTSLNGLTLAVNVLTTIVFTLAVIATIVSGYIYLKDGKDILKDM